MNERIQQLAFDAQLYVDLYGKPYPRAMSAEEADAGYEKFAHLIIDECIRYFNEDYQRNFDVLWREDLSKAIQQHFGIT